MMNELVGARMAGNNGGDTPLDVSSMAVSVWILFAAVLLTIAGLIALLGSRQNAYTIQHQVKNQKQKQQQQRGDHDRLHKDHNVENNKGSLSSSSRIHSTVLFSSKEPDPETKQHPRYDSKKTNNNKNSLNYDKSAEQIATSKAIPEYKPALPTREDILRTRIR